MSKYRNQYYVKIIISGSSSVNINNENNDSGGEGEREKPGVKA
jgi:hypothetical protein